MLLEAFRGMARKKLEELGPVDECLYIYIK